MEDVDSNVDADAGAAAELDPEAAAEAAAAEQAQQQAEADAAMAQRMLKWTEFQPDVCLPDKRLLRALDTKGFARPTEIQRETLTAALRDFKDVLGASPTGTGE